MTTFFKWLNSPRVLVCLLLAFGFADLVVLGIYFDLSKSEWASWVQAIGSIAALLGAFVIASRQNEDGLERDRISDAKRKTDRDQAVKLVIAHCFSVIYDLPGRRKGPQDYEFHLQKIPHITFRNLQKQLGTAPLYDVTDEAVVRAAMDMLDLLDTTIALIGLINGMSPDERADNWNSVSMRIERCRQRAWIIGQNLKLKRNKDPHALPLASAAGTPNR